MTTDWVTISSFATAGGTLVLAVATFASVRSANQAARTAQQALQVNLRPVLTSSRLQDPTVKVGWMDEHWAAVGGGRAVAEYVDGNIYLAMSLRNVGSGLAVIHGWHPSGAATAGGRDHADPDAFRMQTRDLYVPPADNSFWQGAIRDTADPDHAWLAEAITARRRFTIELLYGDHEGGQRTISRFGIIPREDADDQEWMCTVSLHWNLDRPDPR
ncbi:MAG TPA: hypothetical protein VMV22_09815 [Acidimicrobiales bacterium]|nr:hypothetical protein [Acidimicrobiales bacterium]